MREKMLGLGVSILEDFPVQQFERETRGMRKRFLSNGRELEADHFVVATGAMTPFLNHHLGMSIPIEPGKGYSVDHAETKIDA